MVSSSLPLTMEDEEYRNWAELPPELMSSILQRLGTVDILENAQKVCKSWYRVCKDPSIWRKIDIQDFAWFKYDLESICRHAVDRSQGGLIEINIRFCTDELLAYIANRSSNLRILRLIMCDQMTDEGFIKAVVKLPFLEHFEHSSRFLSSESLRVAGQSCPNLRTLKLNSSPDPDSFDCNNDKALAIAQSMPQLRHLNIYWDLLTNVGLNAILDGCPHLDHLDLGVCFNIDLTGDLKKLCIERIKDLKLPDDSAADLRYFDYGLPCYWY